MMGGAWFTDIFGPDVDKVSNTTLEQTALDAVRDQLGINVEPSHVNVALQKVNSSTRLIT